MLKVREQPRRVGVRTELGIERERAMTVRYYRALDDKLAESPSRLSAWFGFFLRSLIWVYRHTLSLILGRQCRFLPTCSSYADEAIRRYGPVEGTKLAFKRVCKCHPWGGSGHDPVP